MKRLTVYQIDSFTKVKFKGNPAGVVVNADDLNAKQMQDIARELNNSETAFIISAKNPEYDAEIRYFTPTIEVPICGHATIAAMYAKALEENLDSCVLRIKTKIGILPFEIDKKSNDYKVIMTQGKFELGPSLDAETINILVDALGISFNDLDTSCPIQVASTGHSKLMVGINSKGVLDAMEPNFHQLSVLSEKINCNGYYVFTLDSDIKDVLTFGRMFAPAIGINEDPVTGNANGPLGGYLVQNKIVDCSDKQLQFTSVQGEAMGRLGSVDVFVTTVNEQPDQIKIKGDAVVVFKTEITV